MIDYISTHLGETASLLAILGTILGAIFWSHKNLRSDISELRIEMKNANLRIDSLYNVMMTFLMNEKK